ncbi:MAG: hypothetical protein HQK50_13015 [Oligoflexia bacterium]|nr:hypothetical protein [Oligoflexia bacterium]
MNKKFQYVSDIEIKKRNNDIERFIALVIDKEEIPYFVSDDASIFDISTDDKAVLINRIRTHYKVEISENELHLKLWQLLDLIRHRIPL